MNQYPCLSKDEYKSPELHKQEVLEIIGDEIYYLLNYYDETAKFNGEDMKAIASYVRQKIDEHQLFANKKEVIELK
jgi:hypothetical protein